MREPASRCRQGIQEVREEPETFFRLSPVVEGKPQCFAVRRGEIAKRFDVYYYTPSFKQFINHLQSLSHTTPIGQLIVSWDRGDGPREGFYTDDIEAGVYFLRINNLVDHSIDLTNVKLITRIVHETTLQRTKSKPGDLIFAISGTKENLGTVAIIPASVKEANLNSALVNLHLDETRITKEFFCYFFDSAIARQQIEYIGKGAAQNNLNNDEISEILLPLPPISQQRTLVSQMESARAARQQKLAAADALLAGLDNYLLSQLGLTPPTADRRQVFAVRLEQLRDKRLDASAYQPFFAKGHPPKTPTKPLEDIADIDQNTATAPADETELVPYIGLPECELTEVREVNMRPYSEVRGRSVIKQGDILFARIEPSVFNKKYVLADDLKGHNSAYTSTEFYVVRARKSEVLQEYLYAMFFCSFVFSQVKGKTTGSSGRRRIDPGLFSLLQIPVPDCEMQKTIATEVARRRTEARHLRAVAAAEWSAAKAQFEQKLLGNQ